MGRRRAARRARNCREPTELTMWRVGMPTSESEAPDVGNEEEYGAVHSCLRNAVMDQTKFSWASRGSFGFAGLLMGFLRLVPAEEDVTGDIWLLWDARMLGQAVNAGAFGAITKYWAPRRTQLPWAAGRPVVREHKIVLHRLPCCCPKLGPSPTPAPNQGRGRKGCSSWGAQDLPRFASDHPLRVCKIMVHHCAVSAWAAGRIPVRGGPGCGISPKTDAFWRGWCRSWVAHVEKAHLRNRCAP